MTSLSDKYFIDLGETRLPVKIKKHKTSRKLTVRYQPLQKSVLLTLPQTASIKQGLHFINEKQDWILRQISNYNNTTTFSDGQTLPVLGKNILLQHIGGRGTISEKDGIWQIHGDMEFMARRVQKHIIDKAKKEIAMLADGFSKKLGVKIAGITLRDTSSRWGSCSYDGNLSFSWRLIFAPYDVLYYVVAHEVAHIREHNHSEKFWDLVAGLHPDFSQSENWLKRNGRTLYKYG